MISVIMAVHRYDKYVDISIDSILNQTYSDFELIIIANGGLFRDSKTAEALYRAG